ncbi:MAG: glutamine-hydrolyzing carbamoyl-phosphate synthase small subunit [Candidatus Thermoplasmatota archaeon]|nr:glutamine-hydrolyzing carbamoyl-phosphate synthase small subunit [Candidatus Thermoplasmatota archaeon]MCL5984283.1 glutamine-hydrolyzing carbamoyl-phosphate synthase small subunit [Candidatus Thermoplasmatota archaeon]
MSHERRRPPAPAHDGKRGILFLEDGTLFEGQGLGAPGTTYGEVVFTTGMAGYPESLTDPSYRGQILLFTYPLLGNYGIPSASSRDKFGLPVGLESRKIQPRATLFRSLTSPHHWQSSASLDSWLQREGIPGIEGIDTRRLTGLLRSGGVQRGLVVVGREIPSPEELAKSLSRLPRYQEENLVREVAPRRPEWISSGEKNRPAVAVVDCGCKASILRALLQRRLDVLRLPPGHPLPERWDGRPIRGFLLGNGPGDPELLTEVIESIRERPRRGPLLGICLGHQLFALASGARTYKMKYGHRGQNKPVLFGAPIDKGYILSENHGFAVDPASLKKAGLRAWAHDPDDGTLEGLRATNDRAFAVQGHPEGAPGPREAGFIFDEFVRQVEKAA